MGAVARVYFRRLYINGRIITDPVSPDPALLLLYDVTNKVTFDNTRAWLSEIREYAQEDVVIMLLGEVRLRETYNSIAEAPVCNDDLLLLMSDCYIN